MLEEEKLPFETNRQCFIIFLRERKSLVSTDLWHWMVSSSLHFLKSFEIKVLKKRQE